MALGDPYATVTDLKNYLKLPLADTTRDANLLNAVNSATGDIEKHCHRQFNLDTTVTQRVFQPDNWLDLRTDDFGTLTGLIVDLDYSGTGNFSQTLSATDYEVYPLNGVVDGTPGWPYNRLLATGGAGFPVLTFRRRGTVRVTAKYGWPSVPAPIKQACLIIAAQKFRLADAPWGVAGMTEFGTAVRIREIPLVKETLVPYIRYPVLGG